MKYKYYRILHKPTKKYVSVYEPDIIYFQNSTIAPISLTKEGTQLHKKKARIFIDSLKKLVEYPDNYILEPVKNEKS